MDPALEAESDRLGRSWDRHDTGMLRDYLVADVEDPRTNVPSVLTRHFLTCAVFGDQFRDVMEAELRFAATMNWLREMAWRLRDREAWQAVKCGLAAGLDNAEGVDLPAFLRQGRAGRPAEAGGVPVPDYLGSTLELLGADGREGAGPWQALDTFHSVWRAVFSRATAGCRPRVLEPACGSANDCRAMVASGLARFLDYTGFDLCGKNIANARELLPGMRFETGNVFAIGAADGAFDYTVVHDLFEHLSLRGLEQAVAEVCRVTRSGLCLGFFQMDEADEHVVRVVDEYHVNTLSLSRTLALFRHHGFSGEAVHIGTLLRWRLGGAVTHNPNAYTVVLQRAGAG